MMNIHYPPFKHSNSPPFTFKPLTLTPILFLPCLLTVISAQAAQVNINTYTPISTTVTGTEYLISNNGHLELLNGANITGSSGNTSVLLNAANAQLTVNSGAQIKAIGNGISAVYVNDGHAIIGSGGLPGSVLLTGDGQNATALRISGGSSIADIDGATLRAEGSNTQRNTNSGVAYAGLGATLNINNAILQAAITPTLNGGFDGVISRDGAQVTVTNSVIEILHDGVARGVVAEDNASLRIENSHIIMNSGGVTPQTGILANHLDANTGSTIQVKNTSVTLNSHGGTGVASFGSPSFMGGTLTRIDADGLTATLTGEDSIGIMVGNNALVTLNNSSITALATGSHGASLGGGSDPSRLELRNSQIQAETGVTAMGDSLFGMTSQFDAEINHSSITSTASDALYVDNAIGSFDVKNGSVIRAGNGVALRAINTTDELWFDQRTDIHLDVDNSQVYGDIITDLNERGDTYGSITNVTLTNNALLQGKAEYVSSLTIDSTSRWNMTDTSDVIALTNQGVIAFSAPSSGNFKNLTVHGNYQGTDGLFILNSQLGDDSSPTDKLIITGDSLSNSHLQVVNADGTGAQTDNGIQIVQVGGNSTGTFQLTNRVRAGLYEYDLYQGNDGSWYLRSIGQPDPGPDPSRITPPEYSTYLGNQTIASTLFMHTLHDRLGELQFTDAYKDQGSVPAVWVRISGNRTDSQAIGRQFELTTDTTLVQLGGDIARWTGNSGDRWHIGVMGGYGHSKSDANAKTYNILNNGMRKTASGKIDGYSIGAYATWYGNPDQPTGPYIDVWGQYAWFDNKVQGNGLKEESYNSSGWTLSIEGGYAFVAGESETRQWMIEPQAQLAYNSYSADDHRDAYGVWIRDGDADGVITRLGARFYSRSKLERNAIQPFIETNWWYNSAKNSLRFDDIIASDDTPASTYELKAGLQGEIASNWQMWGHIGGRWGNNSYSRYEGMIGVKHLF